VGLLVLVWFACTAWVRDLRLPDEGRYVGVAWEMLRSGEWLTPTLNGLPYFHKPPLFYWITAGSLQALGHTEFAARVASMLGATVGVMAMYLFLQRWAGARMARATLLALLAQPLLLIGGQFANLDMLVAGCITATILLLAHAVLSADLGRPYRGALAGAYAMAALGVLAKGLIGFVLPALVVFIWLALQQRWRRLLTLMWWPGVVIFLVIAGPWFVVMQQRFPGFLDYFFVVQHFKRFAAGGFNNVMPFWFYPAVLAIFFLPWLPWLVGVFSPKGLKGIRQAPVRLLMLVWVLTVVLFFSLPQSKLLGYVLPAAPPLVFLVADRFLQQRAAATNGRRYWLVTAGLAVAVSFGTVAWIAAHPAHSMRAFGSVLATQRQAGEPVMMLDVYYFDLPFYARLDRPVAVVGNWDDPELYQRDGQRKELADAGHFAPERAEQNLMLPAALPASLCRQTTTWVLGPSDAVSRYPFLQVATPVHQQEATTLWRVDARAPAMLSALSCR
jgi:4-amino-4-deoxy-L-arabinose transferase-like glycosyltransferase